MTKDFALIKVWIWANVNTFYYLCVVKYVLIAIVCLFSLTASAQSDWHEALQSWMTEEDVEESYSEETMELLAEMADFKINLNQTSREELERLPIPFVRICQKRPCNKEFVPVKAVVQIQDHGGPGILLRM